MNNIIKIENGFLLNDNKFIFSDFELDNQFVKYEILSENQIHIGTDRGIILIDLTCSIDNLIFENINEFINKLYNI